MVLHSADRFRAAAAPHVVVYVFVSNYEWRESETLSIRCLEEFRECPQWCFGGSFSSGLHHTLWTLFQCMFACSHTTIRCLEEFRELLPTMVLHSADRFRAAAAPHVVVYVFVSNYEWPEARFVHTLVNYPLLFRELLPTMVLHSADRFR
ncbi:hypothetical protein TcBrA4_0018080 [Trypanosoma cruzi]|nr:hypothetical protein TcBrA4_0018080 [Trypanosoma cruzi]